MKKLFALLMALTMTVQLVTPAWADAVEDGPEESTEAVEVVQETTEATEETEVPEETEAETKETDATEEVTEPEFEAGEEAAAKVRVRFACTPEDLTLVVYPADGDVDQAIDAEEDGSYLLTAGEYGYLAEAEGYEAAEGRFTVTEKESQVEVTLAQADAVEEVEALDEGVVASGGCGIGLTWVLDENGVLTVSGEGEIWDYDYGSLNGVLNRPAPWEAYKNQIKAARIEPGVTSIGAQVFYGCSSLTSMTIPDSVASIGDGAFSGCSGLTSVTIPEGVTGIGDYTFYSCSSLTSMTIPKSATSIGDYSFGGCSGLTSVNIPESVTSIGEDAFVGCSGLTSVTIPEGVRSINRTFYGCSGLTSVTIPKSVTSIGDCSFYGCSGLTSVSIPESVTSIGEKAFHDCSGLTSVTIPKSVTSIGDYSFAGCSGLMSVSIPESVTSIGNSVFHGCSGLTSMTIPKSVTSIGNYSFAGCSGLMSMAIPESMTRIGEYAFYECSKLKHVYYGGSDLQWKEIQIGTFNWSLTDATIHYGSTHIHNTEHVLGKAATCTQDGTNAYYVCSGCGGVFRDADGTVETTAEAEIIPALGHDMVKVEATEPTYWAAGNNAYYTCSRCGKAFQDAQGETETTVEAETLEKLPSVAAGECGENLLWALTEDGTLRISGNGSMPDYSTSSVAPWYSKRTKILSVVVEPGVTSVGSYAFYSCLKMASIELPEGITYIGKSAFQDCIKLKSVFIPRGIMSIEESVFQNCSSLTSVNIPESVTSIGCYAFQDCSSLTAVGIPDGVTNIRAQAFSNCSSLTSVSIPVGVTCIEGGTFRNCSSLTSVSIPESVSSIEQYAFYRCSSLMSVSIPENVTSIEDCVFEGCSSLISVSVPESVASIGVFAFYGCSALTNMSIPEGVTSIGDSAFYGCSSLTSVSIPEGVTSIEDETFSDCTGLTSVSIPEGVTSIGHLAFYGCSSLASVGIPASVTKIVEDAFGRCDNLEDVYYSGDEVAWKQIEIGSWNEPLTSAYIHYNETHICTTHLIPAVAPTCTTPGNNAYYLCDACGRVYKDEQNRDQTTVDAETLPALGHAMTLTEARAATCTEDGNNRYYICGNCHKLFLDAEGKKETNLQAETLSAFGHTMARVETVAPTCTEAGNRVYYICETCQKAFKDKQASEATTVGAETLPALGHIMTKTEAVTPTHTAPGSNAYYTCNTCHKVFRDEKGTTETTPEQEVLPRLPGIADGKSGALTWIISDEGTLTVSGKGRMPDYSGSALAPWYDYKEQIQAVVIEEGVLSIGAYAFFDCENLAEIQLPGSLKQLGKDCFAGCDSLKLLDMNGVPEKAAEKVTDLQGLVKLDASLEKLVGSNAAFHWELETIPGEAEAKTLAKLTGNKLEVRHSGKFRLMCTEGYTGLTGSAEMEVQSFTVIRPEDRDRMISGETLELSAWAMPFETELSVRWSLEGNSKAYASISDAGVLTAKAVTEPVEITVLAFPVNGEETAEKTIRILPKTVGLSILADGEMTGHTLAVDLTEKRTLTLTAQIQPEGAQTAVTWTSEAPDIASVDDAGTVTLLKPGTAVIRGASADGGASAELMLQVFYLDPADTLTLTAGSVELEQGEKTQLVLSGENAIDPENVLFQIAQSQAQLAEVDARGVVTAKSAAGKVTVVAALKNDPLMRKAELTLQLIQPRDKSPRLDSTTLTLNSYLTAGTTTALVESYNNTIQSVILYDYDKTRKRYEEAPSDSFAAEAEDGTLTVRALSAQKNGTYQMKLVVTCLGGSYDYTLQVKVANSLPKVTVKQIGKFDTFYLDSTAQLTATASGYEVERMELIGADTFRMDEDGNLFYAESYNPGDKIVTKGTLLIYVEGYQVPVEKAVTVATTKTAPKLTLNPSASAVNRALEDPEFRVKVLWKGNALDMTDAEVTPDVGFATVEAQGQYLVFRLTGATGGTAKLSLRLPNWAQAVSLTHKITVDTKLPAVKLGVTTLKLNSLFSAQTARTSVWLTQGNLDISTMDFKASREEGKCIDLSFDPETDSIEAKFNPEIPKPKAGTYSYTYTAYLENGTALPNGTIKVTVAATAPKVKLSAASVKLNCYLAGQEKATVKVTLTGGTGYQVTDFEGLPDYMRYDAESGNLTVVLPNETFTGETCTLCPVVREEESGQEVPLPTKLTLKVRILNTTKLTVSLSAKGKLNTVDPDSAIAYTVTKVNNCLGTVESVDLVGQDGDLFQADLDTSGVKPIVLLRLLPGKSYATNKTYKVRFRFAVCGREILSSVLSVKVTQTALKVTAPKTAVYYLSQSGPLRCSLKANLPLESVALSARTAKEFQQALGGQENLRLTGNRVEFKLTNPGALTAGKSYSVQLELTPENAAENTKPTTIKLTVKVMK